MRSLSKYSMAFLVIAHCAFVSAPVSAQLLSYDGFGSGYTVGAATGQAYQGTGYAADGTWNNNEFVEGGLTWGNLLTTPGVRVNRVADDMQGLMDVTSGGPFGSAGMVGANGNIGGDEVSGTLYYSFLGKDSDGSGTGWAGFNLFSADDEQIGAGNPGTPDDYSIFHVSEGEPAIGEPATAIDDSVRLFVVKAEYVGGGKDSFTAWLDPDPSLSEAAQSANISVVGTTNDDDDNDGFNMIRMRGDNAWEFDEIRIGTTWESVTPVVPEPSSCLLVLVGVGFAALRMRRRQK